MSRFPANSNRPVAPDDARDFALECLGKFLTLFNRSAFESIDLGFGTASISLDEVREVVREFGDRLTPSPESALELIPTVTVGTWAFVYDLWIDDKESDLSIEGWLVASEGGISMEIDNIHDM